MGTLITLLNQEPDTVLELEVEELGYLALQHIVDFVERNPGQKYQLYFGNLFGSSHSFMMNLADPLKDQVEIALAEAWNWLRTQNLLAWSGEPSAPTAHFVTRRGHALATSDGLWKDFRVSKILPRPLLHPRIDQAAWPSFLRAEYDKAVFAAFKEVEVAVREAGGFSAGEHGVPLMRDAFKPNEGPLADADQQEAEQQALRELFAGAIGSYKNPHSHRHVAIDPDEAAEMVILASHLLRIVESRKRRNGAVAEDRAG